MCIYRYIVVNIHTYYSACVCITHTPAHVQDSLNEDDVLERVLD